MAVKERILLSALLVLALGACTSQSGGHTRPPQLVRPALESEVKEGFHPYTLNQVVIYPLELAPNADLQIADEQLAQLNQQLIQKFQAGTSLQLLNVDNPAAVEKGVKALSSKATAYSDRAEEFGRQLGAQGVLYGLVSRYEDADPARATAPEKSAVSFRLWLFDLKSRSVVWTAAFDEANQPLSENLFRLGQAAKEGFRYSSAAQLLEKGLTSAATDLERLRKSAS